MGGNNGRKPPFFRVVLILLALAIVGYSIIVNVGRGKLSFKSNTNNNNDGLEAKKILEAIQASEQRMKQELLASEERMKHALRSSMKTAPVTPQKQQDTGERAAAQSLSFAGKLLPSYIEKIPARPNPQPEGGVQLPGFEHQVDQFFGNRRGLFFIESGAYNGISLSNSLWLERERDWKGMLVEGNPNLAAEIRKSGRTKAWFVNGCLSITREASKVQFTMAGPLGGIAEEMDQAHKNRISSEISRKEGWAIRKEGVGNTVEVNCYPVNDLLHSIVDNDVPVVDFWSLDTEGSEADILKTVDFDNVMFGLLWIEHNSKQHLDRVTEFMQSKGFVRNNQLTSNFDSAWQNPAYCAKCTCHLVNKVS